MVYLGELISRCGDYNFISILVIIKRFLEMMQIVVPILLIVSCMWGLIKLLINPEDKKALPSMKNKVFAALIFIFIPFTVNLVLSWTEESFDVSACWTMAYEYKEQMDAEDMYDVSTNNGNRKKLPNSVDDYEFNAPKNEGSKGPMTGSARGKEIVEYALSFVGKKYVWGGGHGSNESLEEIYARGGGVDCSGFTRLVYRHFGYNLSGTTSTQINDGREVSYSEAQAGDLILYSGHVAIFMGSGNKIVHAFNSNKGIVISDDARYSNILSVRRIV